MFSQTNRHFDPYTYNYQNGFGFNYHTGYKTYEYDFNNFKMDYQGNAVMDALAFGVLMLMGVIFLAFWITLWVSSRIINWISFQSIVTFHTIMLIMFLGFLPVAGGVPLFILAMSLFMFSIIKVFARLIVEIGRSDLPRLILNVTLVFAFIVAVMLQFKTEQEKSMGYYGYY
jgi:hypothetical protein